MNQICQNCENLKTIKFILLEQEKIKLLCSQHRGSFLTQYPHLESMFKEGKITHILPGFRERISEIHQELKKSLSEFISNFKLIQLKLQDKLKQFDALRKNIHDLNELYKKEETSSCEIEQEISRILKQFSDIFRIDQNKAFKLMSRIEPFDNSMSFKLKDLLFQCLD